MVQDLSKKVVTKYVYLSNIEDGTIYDVKTTNTGDGCVLELTNENCPSVTLGDGSTATTLYFDKFIEKGDKYNTEREVFTKRICPGNCSSVQYVYFDSWYKSICEKQIADSIMYYNDLTFEDFNNDKSLLGVPLWIVDGTVTDPNISINFTREYYNEVKLRKTKELILDNSREIASEYGYVLREPSGIEDIDLTTQGA